MSGIALLLAFAGLLIFLGFSVRYAFNRLTTPNDEYDEGLDTLLNVFDHREANEPKTTGAVSFRKCSKCGAEMWPADNETWICPKCLNTLKVEGENEHERC